MHQPACGVHDVVAVVTHACGKVWATRLRSDEYVENDRRGEDWCAKVVTEARRALSATGDVPAAVVETKEGEG